MTVLGAKSFYFFSNWKMYLTVAESVDLAKEYKDLFKDNAKDITVAIFPSALAAVAVGEVLEGTDFSWGAQHVCGPEKGGYTGEVSAAMYGSVGAKYALIGHSERRHLFHETNHDVRQKIEAALEAGLTPVLCVGETRAEREAGQTEEVIEIQLRAALAGLSYPSGRKLVIAYEPVWAISTGLHSEEAGIQCDPAEATKVHRLIARTTEVLLAGVERVILFGGSVRPHNIAAYLGESEIDGVLVGAASTTKESVVELLSAVHFQV